MQWDTIAIAAATLLGPLFAVQVQVWLERTRAGRRRREQIFYALMRTRAASLSPDHVHALNSIPIEFYRDKSIIEAYKAYINHVNSPQTNTQVWVERRTDLLMDLLHKISQTLGYSFTVAQLKGEYYAPKWQFDLEAEQTAIRQGLVNLLSGKSSLPMDVKSLPVDADTRAALLAVLKGEAVLKTQSP
jgi:hypothetical protein